MLSSGSSCLVLSFYREHLRSWKCCSSIPSRITFAFIIAIFVTNSSPKIYYSTSSSFFGGEVCVYVTLWIQAQVCFIPQFLSSKSMCMESFHSWGGLLWPYVCALRYYVIIWKRGFQWRALALFKRKRNVIFHLHIRVWKLIVFIWCLG